MENFSQWTTDLLTFWPFNASQTRQWIYSSLKEVYSLVYKSASKLFERNYKQDKLQWIILSAPINLMSCKENNPLKYSEDPKVCDPLYLNIHSLWYYANRVSGYL